MDDNTPQPEEEKQAPPTLPAPAPSRWWWLLWPVYGVTMAWAYGAIAFDWPHANSRLVAIIWFVGTATMLKALRMPQQRLAAWAVALAIVTIPWLLKQPSNDRDWARDWTKTGHVEIDGDDVTFHNYRNFDWPLDGPPSVRWETRQVKLSNLRTVDYFQDNFGGDTWAHPMVSFDFGLDGYVAMSIEARREVGETYSPIAGLYKSYELQYLFANERDVVRTRTNIRNEPVYLYRTAFSPEGAKAFFLESVAAHNALRENPRFYHALRANCTTSLRRQAPKEKHRPLDHRMVFNGRLDEMLCELDQLEMDGLPFADLRPKALINDAAKAAHDDPDFSLRIRENRPGF